MGKAPSRLLIGIALIAGLAGGLTAYIWNRVTFLPRDYTATVTATDGGSSASSTAGGPVMARTISSDTPSSPTAPTSLADLTNLTSAPTWEMTLTETDLNQLLINTLAASPHTAELLQVSQGIHTSIQENHIESGLVVNLANIPTGLLPVEAEQALQDLTHQLPMLANRDIYLGIQGTPRLEHGRVRLGDDMTVSIGRFQVPLTDLATYINLSPADIEQAIDRALAQQGITPETLQFKEGQLIVGGRKGS